MLQLEAFWTATWYPFANTCIAIQTSQVLKVKSNDKQVRAMTNMWFLIIVSNANASLCIQTDQQFKNGRGSASTLSRASLLASFFSFFHETQQIYPPLGQMKRTTSQTSTPAVCVDSLSIDNVCLATDCERWGELCVYAVRSSFSVSFVSNLGLKRRLSDVCWYLVSATTNVVVLSLFFLVQLR